jgi:glycogen operon protein
MLCGRHARQGTVADNFIYVAINVHWQANWFELPGLPTGINWHIFANTGVASGEDIWQPGSEPLLDNQTGMLLGERSVVILVGK